MVLRGPSAEVLVKITTLLSLQPHKTTPKCGLQPSKQWLYIRSRSRVFFNCVEIRLIMLLLCVEGQLFRKQIHIFMQTFLPNTQ